MTLEDFDLLRNYGKRVKEVNGQPIEVTKLSYIYVKEKFRFLVSDFEINKAVDEALKDLGIKYKVKNIQEYMSIFLYLFDEIIEEKGIINTLETEFLSSNPDPKMIASGSAMLAPFDHKLTLSSLATKLMLSVTEIGNMKYEEVLDWQVAFFRQANVIENYRKLEMKK